MGDSFTCGPLIFSSIEEQLDFLSYLPSGEIIIIVPWGALWKKDILLHEIMTYPVNSNLLRSGPLALGFPELGQSETHTLVEL